MMMGRVSVVFIASIILVSLSSLVFLSPRGVFPSALAETSPNVTVNVTINSFADISLSPTNYTVSLNPGSSSPPINFTITNTGSTNITTFYAYANTLAVETVNPLGSGSSTLYASSGLIFIRNASFGSERAFHLGRLEWNLTANLPGENLALGGDLNQSFGRGWYRNGSNTFLWKVENGTRSNTSQTPNPGGKDNGACNITGTIFKIKRDPENDTSGFMRDFTTGTIDTGTMDAQTIDWGIFSMTSGALNGYCVATYHNCRKIFIYRFDRRANTDSDFNSCTLATSMSVATLYPADIYPFTLFASAPDGMPAGETKTSRLTVAAS